MGDSVKYPAIYGNGVGCNILWFNENKGVSLDDGGLVCNESTSKVANITREYLQNTWGVVESKDHAEFIIELCKANNLSVYKDPYPVKKDIFSVNKYGTLFFHEDNGLSLSNELEQITIPLSPKKKGELSTEVNETICGKSLQQDFSSEQATLDCKELDINVVFTGEGVYILDCINSAEYQLESVDEYNKVVSAIRLLQSKER